MNISRSLAAFALALLSLSPASFAQTTFSPASCDNVKADSTCFGKQGSLTCLAQPQTKKMACPAPYVGDGAVPGTIDSCTGVEVWNMPAQDLRSCTSCPNDLTSAEVEAMQNAVLGAHEEANIRFYFYACGAAGCPDGTLVANPETGLSTGRSFREHIYVTDPFPSGNLPTNSRVNYLADNGRLPAALPPIPGLLVTDSKLLYEMATAAAGAYNSDYYPVGDYVSCSGNDPDHCDFTCTPASAGFYSPLCTTLQSAYNASGCTDAWEVQVAGNWVPTSALTAPFQTSSNPGPGSYAMTDWDWPDVRAWNGVAASDTGDAAVFACNSTVKTCNGWVTSGSSQVCVASHTVTDPINGNVYTVCDQYSDLLAQTNDCTGATRAVVASSLNSSCAAAGYSPPVTSCPTGMSWSGTQCECPGSMFWNGSACSDPVVDLGGAVWTNMEVFTGAYSATNVVNWTKDPLTKAVIAFVIGGGGMGGPTADGGVWGGGGGSAGYAFELIAFGPAATGDKMALYAQLPADYQAMIAAAPAPPAAITSTTATTLQVVAAAGGGTSSFGGLVSASGGRIGATGNDSSYCTWTNFTAGAGGAGSGGDFNFNGSKGGLLNCSNWLPPPGRGRVGWVTGTEPEWLNHYAGAGSVFQPGWIAPNTQAPATAYGSGSGGTPWGGTHRPGAPGMVVLFKFQ